MQNSCIIIANTLGIPQYCNKPPVSHLCWMFWSSQMLWKLTWNLILYSVLDLSWDIEMHCSKWLLKCWCVDLSLCLQCLLLYMLYDKLLYITRYFMWSKKVTTCCISCLSFYYTILKIYNNTFKILITQFAIQWILVCMHAQIEWTRCRCFPIMPRISLLGSLNSHGITPKVQENVFISRWSDVLYDSIMNALLKTVKRPYSLI